MAKGVLVDLTRCIGCRGCQVACKEWNEQKARKTSFNGDFTNPIKLSSDCYTRIRFHTAIPKSGFMNRNRVASRSGVS
jgi:formate dehydrogenase iron-sulfur subunit